MSLILPKGLVINSPQVEGSIESIDAEPLDLADIAKFWKVYTTTKRRLLDPTAERLENYWWRIWGSRSRELKGATVARLFALISDGPTFAPLRGPKDRYEGSPRLQRNTRNGPGASSTTAIHQPNQSRPSTTSSSTTSRAQTVVPHPILKKSRGPSTTGPRPTARFVSPHESELEIDQKSSISPNSHVIVQPPSPDSQASRTDKKATAGKKKSSYVASAGVKKKRPVIVRRQSSQTSQSSTESAARASEAAKSAAVIQSSVERTPPTISEQPQARSKQPGESRFQENFSPACERSPSSALSPRKRHSGKAGDFRRASPRKPASVARRGEITQKGTGEEALSGEPGPSNRPRLVENSQTTVGDLSPEELEELELQRMLLEEANTRVNKEREDDLPDSTPGFQILHSSLRSKSDGRHESEGMSGLRLLQHDTKGTVSLAPTLTAATGQLDLGEAGAAPQTAPSAMAGKGKGRDPDEQRRAEMFAKRPVQPITGSMAASAPDSSGSLSRSKSQLTLLLEKDRERSGDHRPEDYKKGDKEPKEEG